VRAGAHGVFLPPPHFFPYPQEEIREFYLHFARQMGSGIPAYLANIKGEIVAVPFGGRTATETAIASSQ